MKSYRPVFYLSIFTILISSCNVSVNRSIHINDGETVRRSLNSVNGSIHIGKDCVIKSGCRSVNGRIEIGSNSKVEDLNTVNNRISVGKDVIVKGDIYSVNGSVRCRSGVEVKGDVGTVNGSIELEKTKVFYDISTYNGNITLTDNSLVEGDVFIKDNKGRSNRDRPLKISVEGGSTVEGDIIVKADDIEVIVSLTGGGRVLGKIKGAEVIKE
jgi:acetyltransferase-like isoleucine patch superfamily enzyme